jgi:hypothetical protein
MATVAETKGITVVPERTAAPLEHEQTTMYPVDVATRGTFEEHKDTELAVLGLTAEQRATRHRDHNALIAATGVDEYSVGKLLYDAKISADIAVARGEAEPDLQALNEEARRVLADTYGRDEVEPLLTRVREFARQHPKLAAILQTRGIGSQVPVVTALVDHVRRIDWRPRKSR